MNEILEPITQFGTAGLMGILWVWERRMSRKLERQIEESHDRILRQREEITELVGLVRQNTAALERFNQTQQRLCELLESLSRSSAAPVIGR